MNTNEKRDLYAIINYAPVSAGAAAFAVAAAAEDVTMTGKSNDENQGDSNQGSEDQDKNEKESKSNVGETGKVSRRRIMIYNKSNNKLKKYNNKR